MKICIDHLRISQTARWAALCARRTPLARLVQLEGGEEGAVLVAHGAPQRPVRRGVRSHLQIDNGA